MIATECSALDRNRVERREKLGLLRTEEPDALGEEASVTPIRDDHLRLAFLVATETGGDAELKEQQLHIRRELFAVCRVQDLDRLARQERGRAIAREERLEEDALEGARSAPDRPWNRL